uniref:Histone-like protein n=1 Tax=Marseillevirus LCMAC102 TaxID=2506603 RepID=A0A481YTH7_9VIRU|nr:MAG: histone-like protein [Marseillevirus LCMAC102]
MPRKKVAEIKKKKVSKKGGGERRKGSERPDISAAGIKTVLKESSLSLRISKEAQDKAVVLLQNCLEKLGKDLASLLLIAKRKTVTVDMIRAACQESSLGKVCDFQISKSPHERYPLSMAGVLRYTKVYMGESNRFTADAKLQLLSVAIGYVGFLGQKAGCIAKNAAARKTIKERDLVAATKC